MKVCGTGAGASLVASLGSPGAFGKPVRDLLPLSEVQVVEIQGDATRLPAAVVVRALMSGALAKRDARAFTGAVIVHLRFGNDVCVPMTFFPLEPGRLFHQIKMGDGWLELPAIPAAGADACAKCISRLKIGTTTRSDFEKNFSLDGGMNSYFRGVRYVFNGFKAADTVVKLNAEFRPVSVSEGSYAYDTVLGQKSVIDPSLRPDGSDILMGISPFYIEQPFTN